MVRNIIDVQIGGRVAMLRAERGLTSHDVARCLKEMPRTYELRELGELRFSAEQLFTLAKTFGVDLKTIFDDQTGASGSYRLAARPTLRLVSSR